MTEAPRGITCEIPVRWGDMDAIGHVNNTVFFQFCESARIAYFEAIRLDRFRQSPREGPGLVAANLNFRRQLHYPATVSVSANVTAVSGKSFTLSYRLCDRADDAVVADGSSVCVWVDYEQAKALPLPRELVQAIAELEGNRSLTAP